MKHFNIPQSDRSMLEPHHRRFQASVSKLANSKFGITETRYIGGIFKAEGGVTVNKCEIAIKRDYVVDDFGVRGAAPATAEESATVEAMLEIIEMVKRGEEMPASEAETAQISGDTLWSFFR